MLVLCPMLQEIVGFKTPKSHEITINCRYTSHEKLPFLLVSYHHKKVSKILFFITI